MSIPTDKERGAPLTASLITIHKVPRLIVDYELRIPPKDKITKAAKANSHAPGFRGQEKNRQSARKPKYGTAPRIPKSQQIFHEKKPVDRI